MKLSLYIEMLQRKLVEYPQDPEVAITQGGYYAEGCFADIYDQPTVKVINLDTSRWEDGVLVKTVDSKEFLVLGNSYQSY